MTARDKWELEIVCPGCGQEGTLFISENDEPQSWLRGVIDRKIDSVQGNFNTNVSDGKTVKVKCLNCGEEFLR